MSCIISPFSRPGSVFHQVIKRISGHLNVQAGGVIAELMKIGARFVGNPLTIAIDINTGKSGGFSVGRINFFIKIIGVTM